MAHTFLDAQIVKEIGVASSLFCLIAPTTTLEKHITCNVQILFNHFLHKCFFLT